MRGGVRKMRLASHGSAQAQFRRRRSWVKCQRGRVCRFGFRELAIGKQRFAEIKGRAKFLGLLLRGCLQVWNRRCRVLGLKQRHPQIHLSLIQTRVEFQNRFVFRNRIRVPAEHAVGECQVEMRSVILWICCDGFGEQSRGVFEFIGVERFQAIGLEVGRLREKGQEQEPHVYFRFLRCAPASEWGRPMLYVPVSDWKWGRVANLRPIANRLLGTPQISNLRSRAFHPVLGETPLACLLLRCFPLLSRHKSNRVIGGQIGQDEHPCNGQATPQRFM